MSNWIALLKVQSFSSRIPMRKTGREELFSPASDSPDIAGHESEVVNRNIK
jgi:hypothetical protein